MSQHLYTAVRARYPLAACTPEQLEPPFLPCICIHASLCVVPVLHKSVKEITWV